MKHFEVEPKCLLSEQALDETLDHEEGKSDVCCTFPTKFRQSDIQIFLFSRLVRRGLSTNLIDPMYASTLPHRQFSSLFVAFVVEI